MKLKIKPPEIVSKATSTVVSKKVSKELGGDCRIRFTEAEVGMKDGRVYAKFSVDGEMNRSDFMKLVKMIREGS